MGPDREWFAHNWQSGDIGRVEALGGSQDLHISPLWTKANDRWNQAGNQGVVPAVEFGYVLWDVWYDPNKAGIGTATERWFAPVPPPQPIHDPRVVNGNFLALPGFELDKGEQPAFMYPANDTVNRAEFRDTMNSHGLTTVPFSPFASYRQWSYSLSPSQMRDMLDELTQSGLAPLAFILTDHLDGHAWTLDEAKRHMDAHLPAWKDSAVSFAMCWEIDQVRGLEHENTQLDLIVHARQHLPGKVIWDHRQPGWWGPGLTSSGRTEWDYWRHQNNSLHGLLGQQRLGQDWNGSNGAKVEWFESNWGGQPRGIAGRLTQHLGRACAMFEFARNHDAWDSRKLLYRNHPNASWLSGYC